MKRKLVIITISYIIGLLWGLYFNKNITLFFISAFVVYAIIFRKNKFNILLILIIIISCIYNSKIKYNYENKYAGIYELEVVGNIIQVDENNEYYNKYVIEVEHVNKNDKFKKDRLLVYIKKGVNSNNIHYGDKIKVKGIFQNGSVSKNYKGYNYKEYLKTKKIYGIVEAEYNIILKKEDINSYKKNLHKINKNIKQKIYTILQGNSADMCIALVLGDKSNLDDQIIQSFSNSNLSHILAISGMHMTYIITIFLFILKIFKKKQKYICLIFILIVFCNLVGNSESILRATIMSSMFLIGKLSFRKSDSLTNISIASLIILITNPYSIKNTSFLLSFGGTLGIILFSNKLSFNLKQKNIVKKNKILQYIADSIIMSISANIIIIPIISILFNKISLSFIISNIFASFLLNIIMPLIFICISTAFISINIAKFISIILNIFLNLLIFVSNIISKIKILNITIGTPYKITIIIYYFFVILIFIQLKLNAKYKIIIKKFMKLIAIIYIICCLTINLIKFVDSNMYIHFIDVGQGDSTLIITKNNKKILIDGGGSEGKNDYIGKNILMPYLLDRRIKTLDYIMISHFDSDHCKGILHIMENLEVKNIIISKQGESSENYNKFIKLVKSKKINVILVKSQMKVPIDKDTYFDILWPQDNLIQENILNNNSIVAKLIYKHFEILFTGDIELIAENEIIKKANLKADVLKVAHHGSKTSSSKEFLEKVKAKIALIGVGKDNEYGHPSSKTLENLNNMRL